MESVSIREARRRLAEIVDAAEKGQSTAITRHGREVARVGPAGPRRGEPLPDLSEFRASVQYDGEALSEEVTRARKQGRF